MKRAYLLLLGLLLASSAHAANYYFSASGSGTTCSLGSPASFSYVSTQTGGLNPLCGGVRIAGGDTIWMVAGSGEITGEFDVTTSGTADDAAHAVIFRCQEQDGAYTGRCPFNMSISGVNSGHSLIVAKGSYQWFWGLELYSRGCARGTSPFSGTVTTNGTTTVVRATGTSFSSTWQYRGITIGSDTWVIASVTDGDHLVIQNTPPQTSPNAGTTAATVGDAGCRGSFDDPSHDVSHPTDAGKDDGFNIDQTGAVNRVGIRWINNYVHDVRSCFSPNNTYSVQYQIYGNICQNQGWNGPLQPGSHGPAVYAQQYHTDSRATMKHNIFPTGFGQGLQFYCGESTCTYNLDILSNVFYMASKTWAIPANYCTNSAGTPVNCADVGGGRQFQLGASFTTGATMDGNVLFQHIANGSYSPGGTYFHLAWDYPASSGCDDSGPSKCPHMYTTTVTNNLVMTAGTWDGYCGSGTCPTKPLSNQLTYTGNTSLTMVVSGGSTTKASTDYASGNTWLTQVGTTNMSWGPWCDDYETGRQRFGWLNYHGDATATVNIGGCGLVNGQTYNIYNAMNPHGADGVWVASGTYNSAAPTITVALTGPKPTYAQAQGATSALASTEESAFVLVPGAGGANTPTPTTTPSATPTLTPSPTSTASKTPTLTPSPTVTSTPTLTPSQTPTPTATPSSAGLSFPVTLCTTSGNMSITSDALAKITGQSAASTTVNTGLLTCSFNVPVAGNYYLWISVRAPDSNSDSFYINVNHEADSPCNTDGDATCTHIWDTGETADCTACELNNFGWPNIFLFNRLNDRANPNGTCSSCPNVTKGFVRMMALNAGANVIQLRGREVNNGSTAHIEYFYLTTDSTFVPTYPGPTPTPPNRVWCKCNHQQHWVSGSSCKPCPF